MLTGPQMYEDGAVTQQFSVHGAVDLAALAAQRQAQQQAATRGPGDGATATYVIDVTEATFQAEVIDRSATVPVVIDLWATWCGPCKTLSPILERLAAEYAGRFVLAKVDVDAEQRIGAAFQVQSIPSIVAVVKGQPVPLFQGALPEPQVRQYLEELLKVAAQAGVSGTMTGPPAAAAAEAEPAPEPPVDPRFEAAYEAVDAGDWDAAEAAYRAVLAAAPADETAKAGLAVVGLYRRTDGQDPAAAIAAADADSSDVTAGQLAADLQFLEGDPAAAFARLTMLVRGSAGDERDALRRHLIDLFEIAGPDEPTVPKARIALANALF